MAKKTYNQQKDKKKFKLRIGEAYRSTTLLEKAGWFLSLAILVGALALNGGGNPVWAVLGLLGIFALITLLAYKSNLIFSGLILALHIATLPYMAMMYSYITPGEYTGDVVTPLVVLGFATIVFAIIAYRFSVGRYWITLMLVLGALGLGGIFVSMALQVSWGILPGLALAVLTIIIRSISWRGLLGKDSTYISPSLANGSKDHLTKNLFQSKKYHVAEIPGYWPLSHIAYSKKRIYLISTFTPRRSLIVNKNRFYYDGAFIEPMLFEIASNADSWCKTNNIDIKYVTTVALINDNELFPTADAILGIKIAEKGSARPEGQLHLATQSGIDELEDLEVPHLPYKTFQKLEKGYPDA